MARNFNLNKGDRFNLTKEDGLKFIKVDLTWDSEADLDAEAFMLGEDGCILEDADFVFYNSVKRTDLIKDGESDAAYLARVKEAPFDRAVYGSKSSWKAKTAPLSFDESVVGSFDDPGQEDASDDEECGETMRVNLEKVRPDITEIVFCVTIHNPGSTSFKDVKDAKITITDADSGEELCSYRLNEKFRTETAVVAGALSLNEDGEWEFEAVGKGYDGGLQTLVDMYA